MPTGRKDRTELIELTALAAAGMLAAGAILVALASAHHNASMPQQTTTRPPYEGEPPAPVCTPSRMDLTGMNRRSSRIHQPQQQLEQPINVTQEFARMRKGAR